MIAIVDYGAGNLKSVSNALKFINAEHKITDKAAEIVAADKVIFPGVGSFGDTMGALKEKKLDLAIKEVIKQGKPFLGICLGLQVLFEAGEEDPGVNGLGIFKGNVPKLKTKLKIPQIGWNQIKIKKDSKLLDGLKQESFFYFVHSYCVNPNDKELALTTTDYGAEFISAINKGKVYATQFHPEKSGKLGLQILKNFVEKC